MKKLLLVLIVSATLVQAAFAQSYPDIISEHPDARVIVVQDSLTVYAGNYTTSEIVRVFRAGSTCLVYGAIGSFYKVATEQDGYLGYALKESILPAPVGNPQDRSQVILQLDAPVKITSYDSGYKDALSLPSLNYYRSEGIKHKAEYENTSGRKIIAVGITFIAFNVWNEYMTKVLGVSMEGMRPGEKDKGEWDMGFVAGDFAFFTGVAYVSKVRFENGEIWRADLEHIAEQLKKIESSFDAANLSSR